MDVVDVTWKALPKRVPRRPRTWRQAPAAAVGGVASLVSPLAAGAAPLARVAGGAGAGPAVPCKYEYLDHTADVQIHAWGESLAEAFGQAAVGMFGYMTELGRVEEETQVEVEAEGHDLESLLYGFLDECLGVFGEELLVMKRVQVEELDREEWTVRAKAWGETFDEDRHVKGTEVKAITYSNMLIREKDDGSAELYVIVDI